MKRIIAKDYMKKFIILIAIGFVLTTLGCFVYFTLTLEAVIHYKNEYSNNDGVYRVEEYKIYRNSDDIRIRINK